MSIRLLPGDRAPRLKLAKAFNRVDLGPVVFDRPSVVVLWNASCIGCLSAVDEIAAFATPLGVPVYGVAVLVRDVGSTALAASQGGDAAVLALEEPSNTYGSSRGLVTRDWLEPSGRDGVPSVYVVDENGMLAWIGDPQDAKIVISAVLRGTWDANVAREEWTKAISDDAIIRKNALRDITDAVLANKLNDAMARIAEVEHSSPAIRSDPQFACLSLDVLARSGRENEAADRYAESAKRFRGDAAVQTQLAMVALRGMSNNKAVAQAARDALLEVAASKDWTSKPVEVRLASTVLLADAEVRLGFRSEADATLANATRLAESLDLSERTRQWASCEVARLSAG